MIERIKNSLHHERFDHKPSFEELKEVPLIGGDMQPERPVDLTPYEARQVFHWEQRRRSRRVTRNGKRS